MTSYMDNNEATNATQLTTTTATTNITSPGGGTGIVATTGIVHGALNLNRNNTIANEMDSSSINMENQIISDTTIATSSPLQQSTTTATMTTTTTSTNFNLNKKLAPLPLEDFYIDSSHIISTSNGSNYPNHINRSSLSNPTDNYDCDSLSDGHEKTDTTPENLNKKIDDIIDEQKQKHYQYNNNHHNHHHQQQHQQQQHNYHNQINPHHHQHQHQHHNHRYNQQHHFSNFDNEQNSQQNLSFNTKEDPLAASSPNLENQKLIGETSSSPSQTQSSLSSAPLLTGKATTYKNIEPSLVGLGAAIDDSNAKYSYTSRSSPKHRNDKVAPDTFWINNSGINDQQHEQQQHHQQQQQIESNIITTPSQKISSTITTPTSGVSIGESHHYNPNNLKINNNNDEATTKVHPMNHHPHHNHHNPNSNSNQHQQYYQQHYQHHQQQHQHQQSHQSHQQEQQHHHQLHQHSPRPLNENNHDERPLSGRGASASESASVSGGANNSESGLGGEKPSPEDDDLSSSVSNSTNQTSKASKQSCAFTIDHFNDKDCDPAAAAAKYKNMLERFQNRHRRASSLAKSESAESPSSSGKKALTSSASASPLTSLHSSRPNSNNNRDSGDFSQMENSESSSVAPTTGAGGNAAPSSGVKMRVRDRSTSRVRDASKRHSWSPRSTTNEQAHHHNSTIHPNNQTHNPASNSNQNQVLKRTTPSTPTSGSGGGVGVGVRGLNVATGANRPKANNMQMPKAPAAGTSIATRTHFVPRSTCMQLALQKVDFMCPEPPLADFKHLNIDADNLSDTGTYTLDGDNYTEEQKDLMNIDKNARQAALNEKIRPKNLRIKQESERTSIAPSTTTTKRASNVLEVNYYHHEGGAVCVSDTPNVPLKQLSSADDLIMSPHQTAGAYVDKIKSRVLKNLQQPSTTTSTTSSYSGKDCDLNMDTKRNVMKTPDEDFGCFTSVTKSGILAKQNALDPCPKLTRRSSLSTSQIDSSEYVSNEVKMKNLSAQVYPGGSFTDHQKSEYCLNGYQSKANTKPSTPSAGNSELFAATRSMIESPPETPSSKVRPVANLSDTIALKNAQTKNDWIQEWARNARARSLANETSSSKYKHHGAGGQGSGVGTNGPEDLMTRSYTCSDTGCTDSLTDDSIYNNQLKKSLAARHRLLGGGGNGDCDYSSDPSLCSTYAKSQTDLNTGTAYKPPKSPTKIPSPLHSLGRARSASRARPVLQNILSPDGEDDDRIYLEKTAAAINNLQESLSRKGSIKSPSHVAAYRNQQTNVLSPEECSPHNSIGSPTIYRRSPAHRRNLSNDGTFVPSHRDLMTSSINEQQLQLLTSGEYLVKQMRMRKNSFDGVNVPAGNSPARQATLKALQQQYLQQQQQLLQQQQQHLQKQHHQQQQQQQLNMKDSSGNLSPLRRSSSFSTKMLDQQQQQQQTRQRAARPQFQNIYTPPAARHQYALSTMPNNGGHAITKSASSNSFRQMYSDYDESQQYYIADEDEDEHLYVDEYYSSDPEEENIPEPTNVMTTSSSTNTGPLPNTRVNKALLMRMELNKQKIAGIKPTSAPSGGSAAVAKAALAASGGVAACPNTPEVPRRNIKSAPRASLGSARQSMPRDVSLSHLATQVPNSLASAKKQLLQTAASAMPRSSSTSSQQRVQPKYLDISKYKPAQSNNFLRKNDTRSTLRTPSVDPSKRNSTGGGGNLTRTDPSRASNRSVRSMGATMSTSASGCLTGNNSRAMSATRRDISVSKQKETEMAMWKRRSTYDPMKAAMEDRRRKEEAKLLAKQQQLANKSMNSDGQQATSESGTTPRSQRSYSSSSQQNSLDQSLVACIGDPENDLNDEDLECVF